MKPRWQVVIVSRECPDIFTVRGTYWFRWVAELILMQSQHFSATYPGYRTYAELREIK